MQSRPTSTSVEASLSQSGSRIIGVGEMPDRVRAYDWAAAALGPIDTWSKELVAMVNLTLCSPYPARIMWGPEFILIYNDSYRPIPGPRHPAALGKPARHVYEESWAVVGPLLEKAFATGETSFHEKLLVPLPTQDGIRDFYLNYSFTPVFENGKIAGLFGPLHDVTGEVIAARRLRESEARSNRILHSIGDAVIVTDPGARVTRMNPIAEELTGWREADARGLPLEQVFQIVSEESRLPVESPVEKVKRTGGVVNLANHTILIRRDGTEVPIDDSGAPIQEQDGQLSGIVLTFRDIGEKRHLEQQRERLHQEAQARFAELEATYNNAAIAMAMIDAVEFRYIRVNQKLCEMLGLPQHEVVGSSVLEVAGGVPGLIDALKAVASGQPVAGGLLEGELSTSPGVKRFWTMDYMPVFGRDGSVVAIAAASAEITRQKQAEAALMQSEKLAAVGRLASSIAHEINNPLESVTNLLYLAKNTSLPPDAREYLDTAERELHRVSAITNLTLRFHKQTTNPAHVACDQLIGEVLSIYQGRLVNSNIAVEMRSRARHPVCCFEGEIRQVISNLIGNAIDAMHPHGGRLLLRTREAREQRTGAKGVLISVADTGPGISPQTAERIFEPFFTTKGFSGTGLGLWISQEIVHRHQGRLSVRSSPRRGTVFTMYLPFDAVAR
jgi:PAS domain S-box-containing protein